MRVLDVDPELAYRLDDDERAAARRYAVAEVIALDPGPWADAFEPPDDGAQVGLLVLDGLVVHELRLGNGACAELLGSGDLLRPWDEHSGQSMPGWTASWRVLEPTRLAVLDRRFATVASRWPALLDVILRRSVMRSRASGFLRAVTHLTRVDDRLLVLMWFLAERWGRVRPEGVVVPLKLTHQLLAALTAEALGVGRPRRIPAGLARLVAGRDPVTAVVRSARTSNERIKRELGWSPRFPSARQGVPAAVAGLTSA